VSGLDLRDNFRPVQRDEVVPEEGYVVEQGDLGSWGLVKVMSARELPICSATSCCIKDVNELVINVMVEALSTEETTKGEDV